MPPKKKKKKEWRQLINDVTQWEDTINSDPSVLFVVEIYNEVFGRCNAIKPTIDDVMKAEDKKEKVRWLSVNVIELEKKLRQEKIAEIEKKAEMMAVNARMKTDKVAMGDDDDEEEEDDDEDIDDVDKKEEKKQEEDEEEEEEEELDPEKVFVPGLERFGMVTARPTWLMMREGKVVDVLHVANPPLLKKMVQNSLEGKKTKVPKSAQSPQLSPRSPMSGSMPGSPLNSPLGAAMGFDFGDAIQGVTPDAVKHKFRDWIDVMSIAWTFKNEPVDEDWIKSKMLELGCPILVQEHSAKLIGDEAKSEGETDTIDDIKKLSADLLQGCNFFSNHEKSAQTAARIENSEAIKKMLDVWKADVHTKLHNIAVELHEDKEKQVSGVAEARAKFITEFEMKVIEECTEKSNVILGLSDEDLEKTVNDTIIATLDKLIAETRTKFSACFGKQLVEGDVCMASRPFQKGDPMLYLANVSDAPGQVLFFEISEKSPKACGRMVGIEDDVPLVEYKASLEALLEVSAAYDEKADVNMENAWKHMCGRLDTKPKDNRCTYRSDSKAGAHLHSGFIAYYEKSASRLIKKWISQQLDEHLTEVDDDNSGQVPKGDVLKKAFKDVNELLGKFVKDTLAKLVPITEAAAKAKAEHEAAAAAAAAVPEGGATEEDEAAAKAKEAEAGEDVAAAMATFQERKDVPVEE